MRSRIWILYSALAVAVIGVLDTFYLTLAHFRGTDLNCVLVKGCDVVTTSEYATIGPVPLALVGLLYYLVLVALIWFSLDRPALVRVLTVLSGLGFLASLYLLYLQLFVLEALCIYCLTSLGTSTLIFALSGILYTRSRAEKSKNILM